jgi:GNAT superfamily N-acetyltransferase
MPRVTAPPVPSNVAFRAAKPSDADRLAEGVIEALEDYPSFAPPGWSAPSPAHEAEGVGRLLADDDVWCLLAEADGELVGQITLLPAARSAHPTEDPRLGHLRNLFVRRDFRGTGLAGALHAAAVAEARARGFAELRLFTPAAHARARRFYEREGWAAIGDDFHDPVTRARAARVPPAASARLLLRPCRGR